MRCSAPVLLRRLLQRFRWQLIRSKHGSDLDGRAQSEEEGFGDSRDLGRVVEVDNEVPASGPFDGPEVCCFGLKFVDYSLKGWPETSILDCRVSLIHGDAERDHKAHPFLLSFPAKPESSFSLRATQLPLSVHHSQAPGFPRRPFSATRD